MPPLTVIVVTHNRLEYTKRTIASIINTVPDCKLIIYDNYSTDETYGWFRSGEGRKNRADEMILSDNNGGWGSAVNDALRFAKTEYILLSNNDVEYKPDWYETCLKLYDKYPKIGVLGVWKHKAHGVRQDLGDMLIKDDMPGVGWLMKKSIMDIIGPIAEHGPCATKGGNGEDTDYCLRTIMNGYWVCSPKEDVACHIDGY